jgi:hypothetical protein
MRVTLSQKGGTLSFTFVPDGTDRPAILARDGSVKALLAGRTVRFFMPSGWRLGDTHPDLLGAVVLGLVGELARRRLHLPVPVSAEFCQRIAPLYRCDVGPVDPALKPRQPSGHARIGLCYSGGVDSTAALSLLPKSAAAVLAERVDPPSGPIATIYNKDAALRACIVLRQMGREVWTVRTDMEHLREPVGFFTDLAMAAPLLLLADWANLDALAYGLIMEAAYLYKGVCFRPYAQTRHWRRYSAVAAAVAMPWHLITAGLSEMATTRLILESPLQHVAQSCLRGDAGAPCESCWKCFRKLLLQAAVAGHVLPNAVLDRYFRIPDVERRLKDVPIKLEHVIMFILQRYSGTHPEMRALRRTLRVDEAELGWTERWFTPAREVLAEKHRAASEAAASRFVQPMTTRDVECVQNWDRFAANEACGRTANWPRPRLEPFIPRPRKTRPASPPSTPPAPAVPPSIRS